MVFQTPIVIPVIKFNVIVIIFFLVLQFYAVNGEIFAQLFYFISPDYFGTVREVLSRECGCPVMITQGAAGNVSPIYFKLNLNPPDAAGIRFIRAEDALDRMAQTVLRDALPVIHSLCPVEVKRFSMYSYEIELTADVPSYTEALKVAEETGRLCNIDGTGWLQEVQRLNRNNIRRQTERVEVQYFVLNEGCLCGVPNEVMVEFALDISRNLKNELFYFGGYTNGCTSYFPTEQEFDKGGYEVYWSMLIFYMYHGRVFPLRRNSASRLVRFTVDHYY